MALPFLKNPLSRGKGTIPVERVRDLTGRGFSEVEVIDILRKEGYSAEEIDNALTQSLRFAATARPPEPQPPQPTEYYPRNEPVLPTLEEIMPKPQTAQPQ